jgi:hypothetical protein
MYFKIFYENERRDKFYDWNGIIQDSRLDLTIFGFFKFINKIDAEKAGDCRHEKCLFNSYQTVGGLGPRAVRRVRTFPPPLHNSCFSHMCVVCFDDV